MQVRVIDVALRHAIFAHDFLHEDIQGKMKELVPHNRAHAAKKSEVAPTCSTTSKTSRRS